MSEVAAVLIGGTSHVGKSTVALALAGQLGWRHASTDRLARHPGRPWTTDRPHVREHYARLSVPELTAAQWAHYERMWPLVADLVREAMRPGHEGLVLDGSGVLPGRVPELPADRVVALWLTADAEVLRDRVRRTSRIDEHTAEEQAAVRKFVGRTVSFQPRLIDEIDRLGLTRIEVGEQTTVLELVDRVRRLCGDRRAPG